MVSSQFHVSTVSATQRRRHGIGSSPQRASQGNDAHCFPACFVAIQLDISRISGFALDYYVKSSCTARLRTTAIVARCYGISLG
jgi:hypothetical protein